MNRIDTHHHIVPPDYASWLAAKGVRAGGLPIPAWSPDADLELLDRFGIATAILSVSTPGVHLGDTSDARAMARDVNDYTADVVRANPDRYGFFATLTLPDVEGSLLEIDRAFDSLGADGVVLLANHAGTYLGDPSFDPVFAELQRRKAVVFVHPSALPNLEPLDGIPPYVADFLLDTTRAGVNLARSGTLDRCPDLKIILAHAGGFLPYAAYRIASAADPDGNVMAGFDRLQRFYFDVALSSSPTGLPSLLAFARPGHVTYGSDWPYAPDHAVDAFGQLLDSYQLDDQTRAGIDRTTAEALIPRLAAPLGG